MGFFDKIKNLVGGHGVSVFITEIEREQPASATFPVSDSVLKGRIGVHFAKDAEILNHGFRLTAILEDEGTYRTVEIAEEKNEGEIIGSDVSWPYVGKGGEVIHDSFCMIRIDIPAAMRQLGLEPDAAFNDPRVRLELKVWADVKGTPVDASAKHVLAIVEGGGVSMYEDAVDDDLGFTEIPVRSLPMPLDPTPYLARFNAMVEELRANPAIEVIKYKVAPPISAEDLEAAKALYPIPQAMIDFYTQMDGLELEWKLVDESADRSSHGNIRIVALLEVLGDWQDMIWFDEDWDDKRFKPLHPMDFFVPEACAALYLDGSENPTVYYHYCGEEMETLEVDFAGYLELLLASRGYWYWQRAVASDLTGQEYTIEPREFRMNMGKLFSDFDPSFFLRHDYSAKDAAFIAERDAARTKFFGALDAAGVEYEPAGPGANVTVANTPENMQKLQFAMMPLVGQVDFSGDWGMMMIGEYQVSK